MILRSLAIAFVAACPCSVLAQARGLPGNIRGRITDARSGAAIAGAKIAALKSHRWGRVSTDSSGYYLLDAVPPGTWLIEFHCPSRTSLGLPLGTRMVTVPPDGEVTLDFSVPSGACDEPAFSV